jgi:osmoprotectant transport system substrate-binding protein
MGGEAVSARSTRRIVGAAVAALALVTSACGSQPGSSGPPERGSITVASLNSSESLTLANIYAQALQSQGYKTPLKRNLGRRDVVEPALERGEIDLYPGYAASELEFVNKGKGEATPDPQATVAKLRTYLEPQKIKVLEPALASDEIAFAVTKRTANRFYLSKLSDLIPVAKQLTLGAPPECPTQPSCAKGLKDKYGIEFKAFKPFDGRGSPLLKTALERGDVDVALLWSTDAAIAARSFVILDDDRHLQNAENVVPLIRSSVANDEVVKLLNRISARLTTEGLIDLNRQADIDNQDPFVVAQKWLETNGFFKKSSGGRPNEAGG